MHFVLTGFTHDEGFRVFAFERMEEGGLRTNYTVRANLALARTCGIQLQDLPLLCKGLLDGGQEIEVRSLTLTEQKMQACAADRAAARDEAARKRKPPHRPSGENLGSAWRGQQA